MAASDAAVAELARLLGEAAERGAAVDQPDAEPSVTTAYAVQAAMLRRSVAAGDPQVGVKLGFTSRAKMAQMGVDSVIAGFLLGSQLVPAGGVLRRNALIHPRVEPEIAFRISRDVPAAASVDEVLDAVDAVAPALEVIDSRYRDFRFRLGDVIADNTSAARFAVGDWQRVPADISDLAVTMSIAGAVVAEGSTRAILGDPWEALRALRALPGAAHLTLRAGGIVLAGAATEAVPLPESGRVEAGVEQLGRVHFDVRGAR